MIAQNNAQNAQLAEPGLTVPPGLTSEQDFAVHLLCSRLFGERIGRTMLYQLDRSTVAQFRLPPALPTTPRVMRRLKLTHQAVDRLWAIAEATTGLLERDLLDEVIPEDPVWPDLWRVVAHGPSRWGHRVKRLMKLWANGAEVDTSQRKPMKASTLNTYLTVQIRLTKRILELRDWAENEEVALPQEFEQWTKNDIPELKWGADYGGAPSNHATKAPTLVHVRRTLHGVDDRVAARTRRGTGTRLVRWRALSGGFVSTGGRADCLAWMRGKDFIPNHIFPDGTRGPAYRWRQLKGQPGVERIQGVPELVGAWTQEHIDVNNVQPSEPLWAEQARDMLSASPGALSNTIDKIMRLYAPPGDNEAYRSHDIRRVAERCARRYGDQVLDELSLDDELFSVVGFVPDGQTLANILIDHRPRGVDATYKDLLNPAAVEHWARVAALGVWEYVWGERGARRVPDIESIARAHEQLLDSEADRRAVRETLATARRRRNELRGQRSLLLASDVDERVTRRRLVELFDELDAISEEADELADRTDAAAEAVAQARHAVAEASTATVPINDFASDREIEEIRAAAYAYSDAAASGSPAVEAPLRRTFTSSEFAWATGVSPAQMRRYLRGESGYQYLFDTNPDGSVAGVERVSERRRFVHFDELPLPRYPARIIERLQWLMRQPHGVALDHANPPDADEDRGLRARGAPADARMALAGALTAHEIARRLGVSLPTPLNRVRSGRLLAIEDRGKQLFPPWQLDDASPNGVLPALPEILAALGDIPASTKATWFTDAKDALGGRTPVEAIRAGDAAAVVALAGGRADWTPTLNQKETAARIGTSTTMPKYRAKHGLLLALDDEGPLRFPTWQFDAAAPNGVLPGLADALATLDGMTPRAKNTWFETDNLRLGGRSPAAALAAGDVEEVVSAARQAQETRSG